MSVATRPAFPLPHVVYFAITQTIGQVIQLDKTLDLRPEFTPSLDMSARRSSGHGTKRATLRHKPRLPHSTCLQTNGEKWY